MKYWLYPLLSLFLFSAAAQAADDAAVDRIKAVMSNIVPGQEPDSIRRSPIGDLYEVGYGAHFYYVSADGKYLMGGDLYDLESKTNLTETHRSPVRVNAINSLSQKDMIVYPAKGKAKHTITVFTDIDCPYCRKFHEGMKEMNDLGITVRYLAFPRAGIPSSGYDEAVSVWCASDRNKAMDLAKLDRKIKLMSCENSPVKKEFELGQLIGVNATPTLIFEDGTIAPGYLPPQRLAAALDEHKADTK